jgi:hypothetical protein
VRAAFLLTAQSASLDQLTNNLSIWNILEQVSAPTFPIAVPMTIVVYLIRKKTESDKTDLKLVIKLDGRAPPIAEQPVSIFFQGKLKTRARLEKARPGCA